MKAIYFILLFGVLAASATYWYRSTEYICPVPLPYRIGHIDDSFTITMEEAKQYLQTAEAVWENKLNRDLFVYDDTAEFNVDFVFDERQALADSEASKRAYLDEQKDKNEEVFARVENLKQEHDRLQSEYKGRAAAYEERLEEYNKTVSSYNDRGGAPSDIYAELEAERQALSAQAAELSATANELNQLADTINELSDEGNRLVDIYNREVSQYNDEFGFSREFTQGDYQGDKIHIYKFSDENELVTVLAHEFGHALGIDHVEGTTSVMYYLMEETSADPRLSTWDIEAFAAMCGNGEEWPHKIRRSIRDTLRTFNL